MGAGAMKNIVLAVIAILISCVCNAQDIPFEKLTQGKEPVILKRALAKLLKQYEVSPKRSKYITVMLDLDADGKKDALVLFNDMNFCGGSGAGGCSLFAFGCNASNCNPWFNIDIVNPPFYISDERTKGLPDFIGALAGMDGAGKFSILKYDGKAYPMLPEDGQTTTEAELKTRKLIRLF